MDLATTLSVVQTILTAIQTLDELRNIFSFSHHEKKLERFQKTVNVIQSVLEDANATKGELSHQQMNYIEELKDAVYDASDVLDEFVTLVKRKKLTGASHELSDKVKSFLSRFTPLVRNLSNKVEKVNEKLDAIASDASKFMFKLDYKLVKFAKPETSSFVSPTDTIIGRDKDLKKVLGMLLDSNDVNVSSLVVVGMGGLGKTAFAQLVYNDPRVTSAFKLKSWTCIADQDQWNLTYILGKIMKALNINNDCDLTSLEQISQEVRKKLEGKKYLLVLDDVWNENYHEWQELEKFLKVGGNGSRIIVTTRSKKTAHNIGGARVHELLGLSDNKSKRLFERMAFLPNQIENPDDDLVELGKQIVKKCVNVPLAIRVVGSLLRGESKPIWLSFRDKGLASITTSDYTIKNILNLSYHQLDTRLKSCFAYCAIFPKDFKIDKQMLISLWMAQGYINFEYEGEEYFRILLQRCFFQDVTMKDDIDEVENCKIHDLLHDIAEQASGKEICKLNSNIINVGNKVRHLTFCIDDCPQQIPQGKYIRTLFKVYGGYGIFHVLLFNNNNSIKNWKYLRSLDLSLFGGRALPKSIGKLFHLRYLNLSDCFHLQLLPNSITKLVNLQTLILYRCIELTKLPEDIYKLADLTTLNLSGCSCLSHKSSNWGKLTNLHTLGSFVVGGASLSREECLDGLKGLRSLNNLKKSLQIEIKVHENENYMKEDHGDGDYLIHKQHLRKIVFSSWAFMREGENTEQALWENMQPHVNIEHLSFHFYTGETLPRWPRRDDSSTLFYFPNLVKLDFVECVKLRLLPPLENLPHLKELDLSQLDNVEYIVNINLLEGATLSEGSSFFPSLERLKIKDMDKLKGWWPGSEEQNELFPCFAKLKRLDIIKCKMLEFIPISSSLRSIEVDNFKKVNLYPQSYWSLLPLDSKSRFISISDLKWLLLMDMKSNNPFARRKIRLNRKQKH